MTPIPSVTRILKPAEKPVFSLETRRVHERVRQYWQSLKDNRPYPEEGEVDPLVIADTWDWCFLADMRSGAVERGFRYDYMGPELIDAFGVNLMGFDRCDSDTAPRISSLLRRFNEVVESGEPVMDESEFENLQRQRVKYRCCLLPLGRGRGQHVLGCMRWKTC